MMKKNKIQETVSIIKYAKLKGAEEEYYSKDEINKIPSKISNEIQQYYELYNKEPQLILISRELAIVLIHQIELLQYHQMVMLNNKPFKVDFMFGIPALETPALKDLEFKIY